MVSPTPPMGGILLVIHIQLIGAMLDCRSEKAINHMTNIKNVESYIYNGSHLLNINNKGLKELNRDIFAYYANEQRDQIESIYLMYNNVNHIDAGSFGEFLNVKNINFGVNLLETIKRNYFRGANKIDFLNFQSNLITSIETGSFDDLQELEYIYLDDNCLTRIPDHLFHRTTRIRNIFLHKNRLEHLSSMFMRPTQKLYSLNVAENRLQDISNLFHFKGLMALIVSNNKLDPINSDGINGENEMVSLNIDNTTIADVYFVRKLKRLKELYAGHNQIKSFDVRSLNGSGELTYISLQSNPIININIDNVETILTKLNVLDISSCPIMDNCRKLLELYNQANDKSLNVNVNSRALSRCLRI